jgi:hypothetical protein
MGLLDFDTRGCTRAQHSQLRGNPNAVDGIEGAGSGPTVGGVEARQAP